MSASVTVNFIGSSGGRFILCRINNLLILVKGIHLFVAKLVP